MSVVKLRGSLHRVVVNAPKLDKDGETVREQELELLFKIPMNSVVSGKLPEISSLNGDEVIHLSIADEQTKLDLE